MIFNFLLSQELNSTVKVYPTGSQEIGHLFLKTIPGIKVTKAALDINLHFSTHLKVIGTNLENYIYKK